MPGLAGLYSKELDRTTATTIVGKMQNELMHQEFYINDPVTVFGAATGSLTDIRIDHRNSIPVIRDEVSIWLYGEIYDIQKNVKTLTPEQTEDTERMLGVYLKNRTIEGFKEVDGRFTAVIVDLKTKKINLITDRYGGQQLYWAKFKDGIVWASELKAFRNLPEFELIIDEVAVDDFLNNGY